jgi:hypothetical protein
MFRDAACGLVWFSLALAFPYTVAVAQVPEESPVVSELRERLTNFFGSLRDHRTQEAYAVLFVDSQLAKPERQNQREQLIKKTAELESVYGRARGYELIQARKVGADLVLFKYLYKCEEYPVVWYIAFYRDVRSVETGSAYGSWKVISVRFDTDLESLLK